MTSVPRESPSWYVAPGRQRYPGGHPGTQVPVVLSLGHFSKGCPHQQGQGWLNTPGLVLFSPWERGQEVGASPLPTGSHNHTCLQGRLHL